MARINITENELKKLIIKETFKAISENNSLNEGWFSSKLSNERNRTSNVYSNSISELGPRELFNFATSFKGGRKFLRQNGVNSWGQFSNLYNEDATFKDSLISALSQEYTNQQNKAAKKYGDGDVNNLAASDYAQENSKLKELQTQYDSLKQENETLSNNLNTLNQYFKGITTTLGLDYDNTPDNELYQEATKAITTLKTKVTYLTKTNQNLNAKIKQLTAQITQQQGQIAQTNAQMYNDQAYAQQKAAALSDPSGTRANQMLNNQVTQQQK